MATTQASKERNVNAREKHVLSLHGAPLNNHFNICNVVRNETLKPGVAITLRISPLSIVEVLCEQTAPNRYYFGFTQGGASVIMELVCGPAFL